MADQGGQGQHVRMVGAALKRQHLTEKYERLALQSLEMAVTASNEAAKEVHVGQALDYYESSMQARRGERDV